MQSRAVIEKLAAQKLAAAKCLLEKEHYDDAYYLAGYSIELYLKAVICKTLGADNFYSPDKTGKKQIHRAFKSHDLEDLLLLSGIETEFQSAINEEEELAASWADVIKWNESTRYATGKDSDTVKEFINSSNIICTWIQKLL